MSKKLPDNLTATSLRLMLLGGVIVVVLLQIGLIVLGQNITGTYGQEVAKAVAISKSDEATLHDLESVNNLLKEQAKTVKKSSETIANKTDTYSYQNQIIKDLTVYSQKANIQITGYAFSGDEVTSKATPNAAAASTPTAKGAPAIPPGVTPVTVTLSLAPGVSYASLYTFLQLVEGNLLRMEVQGLNLSRSPGGSDADTSSIGLSTLNLQVYRQK